MGLILSFLGQRGLALALVLVNRITRPLARWWWVGPLVVLFAWGAVPIMRRRFNVMNRDDYSRSARFWWAPGWPWFGLVGAGCCLVASPLLHPALAARWEPSAWLGFSVFLGVGEMGALVFLGLIAIIWGLKLYIGSWVRDRETRYRAWRWRQGSRPRVQGVEPVVSQLPKGCPFAEICAAREREEKKGD